MDKRHYVLHTGSVAAAEPRTTKSGLIKSSCPCVGHQGDVDPGKAQKWP